MNIAVPATAMSRTTGSVHLKPMQKERERTRLGYIGSQPGKQKGKFWSKRNLQLPGVPFLGIQGDSG